jgi:ribosome-binding factor A
MTTYRQQRISDLLHQELSLLIGAELSDPRLEDALVTVTRVVVSPDLHNARVSIEHALPRESSRQVVAALKHAEGFLRRAIAENLNLRVVPELSFHVDETEHRARHIDQLLDSLATEAQPAAPTPENDAHEHTG